MNLVVGIDGGGTSTRACIMDAKGKTIAVGKAGPSSIDTVSLDITEKSIHDAVASAVGQLPPAHQRRFQFPQTGANPGVGSQAQFSAVMAGLGGIVSKKDQQDVETILSRIPGLAPGAPVLAANDMKIALAGGTAMKPGIVTIMGTGSVTYGRNADGREHKTGGWGWKEGDPGSSFDLGISAIRAYVRAGDGRATFTDFTRDVQKRLGISDVAEVTTLLYQNDMTRTEIAALAPAVTTWADMGDPVALAIVDRACAEVRDQIATVFRIVFAANGTTTNSEPASPVENVFVGSLANAPGRFRDTIVALVSAISPRIRIIENRKEPVEGAALWALSLVGGQIAK